VDKPGRDMAKSIFEKDDLQLKFKGKTIIVVVLLLLIGLFIGFQNILGGVSYAPSLASSTAEINSNINSYPDGGNNNPNPIRERPAPMTEFVWIVYILFFIAGYFVTVIARKFVKLSKNDFALALSLAGTLLIFISLLLLLNLSTLLQNIENDPFSKSSLYSWMFQFGIFIVIGIAMALLGNHFNKNRTPLIAILSFVAVPTLFLESIFLLGAGVRDYLTYTSPSWATIPLTNMQRFGWIGTFILLGILTIIGFKLLRQLKDKNALNAFSRSLKIAGWIFSGIGLILFVLFIIQFNFADFNIENFLKKIAEPIAYAIIGGISLLLFERLKK
jgi:hypothetical protein